MAPGPAARAAASAWVKGLPRGGGQVVGRGAAGAGGGDRAGVGRVEDGCHRGIDDVGTQDHAGAAAKRGVVDGAVTVGGEVADVDSGQRPEVGRERAAGKGEAERAGEGVGEEGEDGRAPGHRGAPAETLMEA